MYIETEALKLSDEEIRSFINEYFNDIDKFYGNIQIIASMRELLYEANYRGLYSDAEIRAMGAQIK